jgi:hypothetical protein
MTNSTRLPAMDADDLSVGRVLLTRPFAWPDGLGKGAFFFGGMLRELSRIR